MIAFVLAAAQLFAPPAKPAPPVDCRFDSASLAFAGSPVEQARFELRHVEPGGSAAAEAELPPTLAALVGQRPQIDFVRLASALRHGDESDDHPANLHEIAGEGTAHHDNTTEADI